MAIFTYHINLDERGEFFADVRRANGSSVFEFRGFDIFDDGYMKHKNDTKGLEDYLVALGTLEPGDRIGTEAEAEAEANSNVLRADPRNGQMLLPNGTPLFHRYPAGDFDDIEATNPNLNHLRKALYDARECGEVPDVSVFILPNGDTIDIDTPEPEEEYAAPALPGRTIDLTPTWSAIGELYIRLAESNEREAIVKMRGEIRKAFAIASAAVALSEHWDETQKAAFNDELAKHIKSA